jgi:hypothetical protein
MITGLIAAQSSARRLPLVKSFILLYPLVMNKTMAIKVIPLGSSNPDK